MVRCSKKILISTLVIVNSIVILTFWFIFPQYRSRGRQKLKTVQNYVTVSPILPRLQQQPKRIRRIGVTKYILYWIPMWDSKSFSFGKNGYELFQNCELKNCFATHNRSLFPIQKFHAIIFHTAQYNEWKHDRPWARKPHQRYIFANMEAPIRVYPDNLDKFESFYNWTMTYRLDSDLVRPYGYITKTATNYTMPHLGFIKNKTGLIAWFASNCRTINRREEVYRNLRQFLNIDVYGPCGSLQCPKTQHESASQCYDLVERKYKFYLSFENSHCRDYVTEKLYKILERDVVPVVYGGADYKKLAPPHSVIIADDYASAEKLANYLLYLDRNIEEYLKYFEWKKLYRIEIDGSRTACKLCKMLNSPLEPIKIYKDIFSWWVGKNHSHCKLGDALPDISVAIY